MVKGIVRNFDNLGRIVIPKEMRKVLGIGPNEPADIYFKDGVICIEPCRVQCVCCGAIDKELLEVNEVQMCENCVWKYREEMAKNDKEAQKFVDGLEKRLARKRRIGGC